MKRVAWFAVYVRWDDTVTTDGEVALALNHVADAVAKDVETLNNETLAHLNTTVDQDESWVIEKDEDEDEPIELDEAMRGIEAQIAREDARRELAAQMLADESMGTEPHAEMVRKYAPEGPFALTLNNGRPLRLEHPEHPVSMPARELS